MALSLPSRFRYIGTGPVLVATLLAAALIRVCWPIIHGVEVYPDPVASNAALNNIYKTRDFVAIGMAAILLPAITLLIAALCRWVALNKQAKLESLNTLLLASLIPAAWRIAVACSIPAEQFPPLPLLAVFPLVAIIGIVAFRRFRDSLTDDQPLMIGSAMMLGTLLAFFAGLAIPVAITRLIPAMTLHMAGTAGRYPCAALALVCTGRIFNWIKSSTAQMFEQRTLFVLKSIQLPLPLLLFCMIPAVVVDPQHRFAIHYPTRLVAALALMCAGSWFFMWRQFFKTSDATDVRSALSRAIAPASVAAMLLFAFSGASQMPIAFRDYFHFGEQALPWQQMFEFGKRPYVDFVPIHGLMSFLRGGFNQIFFDNTAASFPCADALLVGLACVTLGLTASAWVGPLGAMFLLLGCLPGSLAELDRMYFLAPALFLITAPALLKRPARALCLWFVVCLLMVAYNATVGPAFVLGTLPVALWFFYRSCRQTPLGAAAIILVGIGIFILGSELPPLRVTVIAFWHFLADNAWTNEIAHAISFQQGFHQRTISSGPYATAFGFEIARCGWLGVCLIATWLLWRELHKPRADRNAPLVALAICVAPVMLLTAPWVLGRIEPGELGRSGSLTHVCLFAILPALVMLAVSRRALVPALLLLALVAGYFYPANPTTLDLPILLAKAIEIRAPLPQDQVVDGAALGLSHVGQVIRTDGDFLNDLASLKKITSGLLTPDETFLDLTNQTALYYYLDLPIPTRYAAFVAANSRLQRGELAQLHAHPVHAVLIDPSGWIDDLPASLRCYEIYRDYVLKFPAVDRKGWVFLFDPARYHPLPTIGSEDQLKLLDHAFCKPDLQRLPISWGQSWAHMRGEFTHVTDIKTGEISFKHSLETAPDGSMKPAGPQAYFEYPMPKEITAGADADFVRIKLEIVPRDQKQTERAQADKPSDTPTGPEPAMACFWASPPLGYSSPIYFKAGTGNLLLPLGAYPRWLLCHGPTTFRLDLLNPECAKSLKVTQIEFLKFTPK